MTSPSELGLESISLWMATEAIPPRPPLTRDQPADVCVIGAGIAGLSAAYQLARAGKSVDNGGLLRPTFARATSLGLLVSKGGRHV